MGIKHSLLALLSQSPATASQLQALFDAAMGGVWPLNIGQVAQTLSRLERDELIATEGESVGPTGRRATVYAITTAGRSELESWWSSPVQRPEAERDELVIKITLAAQRSDIDLLRVLDKQRFSALNELRELNAHAALVPEDRSAQRLAIERRIFELEGQSRWLDRVEALAAANSRHPHEETTSEEN